MMMSQLSRTNFVWHCPLPKSGIIFFMNALLLLWSVTLAKTLDPILWDKNSANFTSKGINITVEINDLIDIECPRTENTTEGRLRAQFHKFTQVSYQGYQQCSLSAGRKRHLLSCNRPFQENKLTLLFQEYTPYPGGATFSHGEEYYFITTSDGTESGIDNLSGGLCASNYMKLRVYIKPRPTASPTTASLHSSTSRILSSSTTADSATPTTRPPTTTVTTTTRTTAASSTTTRKTTLKSTEATTKEQNKISDARDNGASSTRSTISMSLLLVSWLVAFVRWFYP